MAGWAGGVAERMAAAPDSAGWMLALDAVAVPPGCHKRSQEGSSECREATALRGLVA